MGAGQQEQANKCVRIEQLHRSPKRGPIPVAGWPCRGGGGRINRAMGVQSRGNPECAGVQAFREQTAASRGRCLGFWPREPRTCELMGHPASRRPQEAERAGRRLWEKERKDSQRDLGKPHRRRNVIRTGSTVNCTRHPEAHPVIPEPQCHSLDRWD